MKCLITFVLALLITLPVQANDPKNVDEVIARMSEQLDALTKQYANLPITITNKPNSRHFAPEIKAIETTPFLTDFEFRVHSPKVTKELNFAPYLEMELPEGMVMLGYSQLTHGGETLCLFKIMLEKGSGVMSGEVNQFRPYTEQYPISLMGFDLDGGVTVYRPKNLHQIKIAATPGINSHMIKKGPDVELNENEEISNKKIGGTLLQLYASDLHPEYDYYVTRIFCGNKTNTAKRFNKDAISLYFRKDGGNTGRYVSDYKKFILPAKFTKLVGKLMALARSY